MVDLDLDIHLMCGIAGIFKFHGPITSEDIAAVQRMLDAQAHRGPDGEGIIVLRARSKELGVRSEESREDTPHCSRLPPYSSPFTPHSQFSVVLGHRRLSIIDLSEAGKQPMSNKTCAEQSHSNRTVWVTYNGEIYNFPELRRTLSAKGYTFLSQTDTEVLVHGYEEWGIEGLLSRLRGMFAFALYDSGPNRRNERNDAIDSTDARLILAKDRFGIKPLYYYQDHERMVFASEVQALMRTGMVPDEKNLEALVRFLQLGSVPVPQTTIKGVRALPAGHYLVVDQYHDKLQRYWDLAKAFVHSSPSHEPPSFASAVTATRALLDEAVQLHLVSDVPLGVFLSGGIDSSALVALASRFRDKPLTTLSIVFDEPVYSEARYAQLVAQQYQTDHHEVLLRSKDFVDNLPQIFAAMDQPTVDGVNTYFVSKAAKQVGLTVVLSGIGGDEVFLGYDHFRKIDRLNEARNLFAGLPLWVRKGLLTMAIQAGALTRKNSLEKLAYLTKPSDENVYLLFRGLFAPRQIQDLLGMSGSEFAALGPIAPSLNGSGPHSLSDSASLFEFNFYLQNQLLKDADCMSMAHSIETRVPYLDHRLVEYVSGLPVAMKLCNGMNKPLLLKALGDDLPREVWDRQKMGFTFPFAQWLQQWAGELQASSMEQGCFHKAAVAEVWKGFKAGQVHWSRPWALAVLAAGQ